METSHRVILAGVAGAAFLGPFTQTVYTPNLPELQQFFDVNTVLINLTISLFTAILAVSNFVVGPLADTFGRRTVLLPGLLLFSGGSLLCLASDSYAWFLTGRALQASGISTALLVAPTVIGDTYTPDARLRAMSVYQTVTFLGPVFGPLVGGAIASYFNWRWAFALLAAAGLAAWTFNLLHLKETLPKASARAPITPKTFLTVLANRSALAIVVIAFNQFYGYYVFLVFLPSLLETMFASSVATKGLFFVPLTAGILIGIGVGARWQRHWSRTRILTASSYGLGAAVLALWLALMAGVATALMLVAILLAYGVLLGCSLPVQSTILINLFSKEKGTAVGVYNFLRFTGAAIGPMVGGFVQLRMGIEAVFLNVALLLGASAVLVHHYLYDPYESR